MKNYKTNFIVSAAISLGLLIGCTGAKQTSYNIVKEPQIYEEAPRLYNFDNKNLPKELKNTFKTRIAQGYDETFAEFLECVDEADSINDNNLTE